MRFTPFGGDSPITKSITYRKRRDRMLKKFSASAVISVSMPGISIPDTLVASQNRKGEIALRWERASQVEYITSYRIYRSESEEAEPVPHDDFYVEPENTTTSTGTSLAAVSPSAYVKNKAPLPEAVTRQGVQVLQEAVYIYYVDKLLSKNQNP